MASWYTLVHRFGGFRRGFALPTGDLTSLPAATIAQQHDGLEALGLLLAADRRGCAGGGEFVDPLGLDLDGVDAGRARPAPFLRRRPSLRDDAPGEPAGITR